MRVAHFIQRYPPALGGSEAYFQRLSQFLCSAGDEVTVWTSTALDLEAFWSPNTRCLPAGNTTEDGVDVRRYQPWQMRGRRYLLKPLTCFPNRVWQCLCQPCNPIAPAMWRDAGRCQHPYDVVHASAFPYAGPIVCALRLARRLPVPFLLTPFLHLGDPEDRRNKTRRSYTAPHLRWLLRAADRIFVQTQREYAAVCELGVPTERVFLQGLGVDPVACTGGKRDRARARWCIGRNQVVIGHLANLSVEKGSVDLLKAAEILWRRGLEFSVVLAGPDMPNFRRYFADFQYAERVRLMGVISDAEKADFFAGLDIFALPSRSDSFGLVLLEAWSNGLPNVVYRAGGPAELVRDERDGLVVPCGSVDQLAVSLGRLIADSNLRNVLGQAGKRRIPVEFKWTDKLQTVRAAMQGLAIENERAPANLGHAGAPC